MAFQMEEINNQQPSAPSVEHTLLHSELWHQCAGLVDAEE